MAEQMGLWWGQGVIYSMSGVVMDQVTRGQWLKS